MYGFILFKNIRGTTKLNLQLNKDLESLADLTNDQVAIIDYMTNINNYNFILTNEVDLNAITLNEKAINIEYCKGVVENEKRLR